MASDKLESTVLYQCAKLIAPLSQKQIDYHHSKHLIWRLMFAPMAGG
jgi:hypothetical protein